MGALGIAVTEAVRVAFDVVAEFTVAATYKQKTTTGYNTTTGAVPADPAGTAVTVFFSDFKSNEVDGETVRVGDKRARIKASELSAITPSLDDFIVEGAVNWGVLSYRLDATKNLYRFHVRRMST